MSCQVSSLLTLQISRALKVSTKSSINLGLPSNKYGPKIQRDQEYQNTPNSGDLIRVVWLLTTTGRQEVMTTGRSSNQLLKKLSDPSSIAKYKKSQTRVEALGN